MEVVRKKMLISWKIPTKELPTICAVSKPLSWFHYGEQTFNQKTPCYFKVKAASGYEYTSFLLIVCLEKVVKAKKGYKLKKTTSMLMGAEVTEIDTNNCSYGVHTFTVIFIVTA